MSAFLHEFRRIFASRTLIAIMILVIVLSSVVSVGNAVSYDNSIYGSGNINAVGYGYGSNGTYNIVVHLENFAGNPVQGDIVNLTPGTTYYHEKTDLQGYANFTITGLNWSEISAHGKINGGHSTNEGGIDYSFNSAGSEFGREVYVYYGQQSNRYFFTGYVNETYISGKNTNVTQNFSRYNLFQVNYKYSSYDGFNILYEGGQNKSSPPVDVYYLKNTGHPVNLTTRNMTYYETLSGFASMSVFPTNLTKGGNETSNGYTFALFTPSGKLLGVVFISLITAPPTKETNNIFFSDEAYLLGIFVPMMAAVSSYLSFGKDAVSGVIDSSLVRPISRRGLIASRYLSNVSAVSLASAISLAYSAYLLYFFTGGRLSADAILLTFWGIAVGACGFVGLMYLAANIFKSQNGLLWFFLGITIAMDVLWTFSGILPGIIVSALGLHMGSYAYDTAHIVLMYLSPASYIQIAAMLYAHFTYFPLLNSVNSLFHLGISMQNLVIFGALWVLLPFVLSVFTFERKRW